MKRVYAFTKDDAETFKGNYEEGTFLKEVKTGREYILRNGKWEVISDPVPTPEKVVAPTISEDAQTVPPKKKRTTKKKES